MAKLRRNCLQCIKLTDGNVVPRPLGAQLIAEYPGEVISMDYLYIGKSSEGLCYILILVDKFSKMVRLIPTEAPTAIAAAQTIMEWAAEHGIPSWLISDGGSHFKNQVFELLATHLNMEHHITTAYCPWANGSVERVCREVLRALRGLCSELQLNLRDWVYLLPMVAYTLNHRLIDGLGSRTPIEVMTGRCPTIPAKLILWKGVLMRDREEIAAEVDMVNSYMDDLHEAILEMHNDVQDQQKKKISRQQRNRRNKGKSLPNFEIGDYVMIITNRQKKHKLEAIWQGPYEVTHAKSEFTYGVRLIGTEKIETIHVLRMKRFAGQDFGCTAEIAHSAQHDAAVFEVEEITNWKINESSQVLLRVHWRGWEKEEDSWETAIVLHEDVPAIVEDYLRAHEDEHKALSETLASLE